MDAHQIERGIAQGAHVSAPLTELAKRGILEFLREQVVDAEWQIARHKARIAAYEQAIAAIGQDETNLAAAPHA